MTKYIDKLLKTNYNFVKQNVEMDLKLDDSSSKQLNKEEMIMKKTAKKAVAVLMMLALVFALSACGGAGSSDGADGASGGGKLQEVLNRGHLIVGTGSTNAPWHFYDDDGKLAGFDVEMAKILANSLFGDPEAVEFVEQSSDERVPNLVNGNVDICFQFMTISAERAQQIEFTVPYYTEGAEALLHKNGSYTSAEDLLAAMDGGTKVTIAILQNSYAEEIVASLFPEYEGTYTVDQYEDQALLYQALESGRCDAAVCDMSNANYQAATDDAYIASGISGYPQNYGAGVQKGDAEWLNYVDTVLIDAMTGATYQSYIDAYEKWFGVTLDPPTVGKPSMYR